MLTRSGVCAWCVVCVGWGLHDSPPAQECDMSGLGAMHRAGTRSPATPTPSPRRMGSTRRHAHFPEGCRYLWGSDQIGKQQRVEVNSRMCHGKYCGGVETKASVERHTQGASLGCARRNCEACPVRRALGRKFQPWVSPCARYGAAGAYGAGTYGTGSRTRFPR